MEGPLVESAASQHCILVVFAFFIFEQLFSGIGWTLTVLGWTVLGLKWTIAEQASTLLS